MNHNTDGFINWLYNKKMQGNSLINCSEKELEELLLEKRKLFCEKMGLNLIESWQHKPDFRILDSEQKDGYKKYSGEITTLPNLVVPFYILEPEKYIGTVIYTTGHGDGVIETIDEMRSSDYQKALPIQLVKKGYRVYLTEPIGFGGVTYARFKEPELSGCYANSVIMLLHGLTLAGLRVNQTIQIADYINKEENKKPFLAGISGGGLVTAFTAAVYKNIAGAFISCYTNTFFGSIMAMNHCIDNYVHDVLSVGEEPEIISLAVSTPILVSAGTEDSIFPLGYTNEACESIRSIYRRFSAEDKFEVEIFTGTHEISTKALFPWLEKHQ